MPPKSKKNIDPVSPKSGSPKNKTKRCPKGEYRNPKTGVCEKKVEKMGEKQQIEMREKPKNLSKMTIKEKDIYEKRKSCIDTYRKKLPSLMDKMQESQEKLSEKLAESGKKSLESKEKSPESESPKSKTPSPKNKQKRCPKGYVRNQKTGECEKKVK